MKSRYLPQCLPVIILIDIILVILFVYIVSPKNTVGLKTIVTIDTSIIDNVIVSNKGVSYIMKKNRLVVAPEGWEKKYTYSNFECDKNQDCYSVFKNYLPKGNLDEKISFFLPNKIKNKIYSYIDNICFTESSIVECGGFVHANLTTGEVFICDVDMDAYQYIPSQKKPIAMNEKCPNP